MSASANSRPRWRNLAQTLSFTSSQEGGITDAYNLVIKKKVYSGKASSSQMSAKLISSAGERGPATVEINCAIGRPYLPKAITPDIDYNARVTIDPVRRSLTFDGRIDAYPAFEAYASFGLHNGAPPTTVALFQIFPSPYNTPENLVGGANKVVRKVVVDSNRDGKWESSEVRRF